MAAGAAGVPYRDLHALCLHASAEARGVPADYALAPEDGPQDRWLRLRVGDRAYFFRRGKLRHAAASRVDALGHELNGEAHAVTLDKALTSATVAAVGVPSPGGAAFPCHDAGRALAMFRTLGGRACVKPNEGKQGVLAFPAVRDEEGFMAAFAAVGRAYPRVLVEESVPGEVVRFFYVHPRVVGILLSRCANVVGDGRRSVRELALARNAARLARAVPGHYPIRLDARAEAFLAAGGRSLAAVPRAGERVFLCATSNGHDGAERIECAASVHPSYARQVETACAAVPGLLVAAADVMVTDPQAPARLGNHWLLDLNASPGLVPYHMPWQGRPQDVGGAIIDLLLAGPPIQPRVRQAAPEKVLGGRCGGR